MKTIIITEKEINLIKRRLNAGKKKADIQYEDIEYRLTPEQTRKALKWLLNLWKSPTGKERINNPFGYREQDAIKNIEYITFDGFLDDGNIGFSYFTPIYTITGKESNFQYIIKAGKPYIIE